MSDGKNFDEVFTQVAGRLGGIQPLLDAFFGFLCRKTDFYVQFPASSVTRASMGFPPGVAEKMVLDSFRKYPLRQLAPEGEDAAPSSSDHTAPDKKPGAPASTSSSPPPPQAKAKPPALQLNPENGKQIPIGNGGYAENYYWTQTINEVTVYVDVPAGTRGKEVACELQPRALSLALRGRGEAPVLAGELEDVVRLDESMWTVASDENSTQVIITLDKQRKTWWKHVLVGDPEIDTTKVDSQQKIDEYDEQTQATIRKLMFDQKQKRLGLPTSEESAADELLARARDAPGSPFLQSDEGNSI